MSETDFNYTLKEYQRIKQENKRMRIEIENDEKIIDFQQKSKEELRKYIYESEEFLQKLEDENNNFKLENENYIKRIQIQAEQILKYEKETKELNSKCQQLQINFANADKDRNQLKIDLTNLKNQYDLKLSENQKYEEEIKFNRLITVELEKAINDQKEKIAYQQSELERRQKTIDRLSDTIDEKDQKIYSYMDDYMKFSERLSTMVSPLQESNAECQQKLESENNNFKSENENYIKRIQIQAEQIMKYEKETKELNSKCEQLQINFANADKDRNQLKIDLTNLKNVSDLKLSENQKYEEEIKFNRLRTVELEKTINDQKEKIAYQQSELERRYKTMERLSDTIDEKNQKIYSYMDDYMKVSERLSTMVSPLQEQNAEQKQINELKKQIQELQQNLFEYKKTCQELAQKNKDYEEEIKKLNQELKNEQQANANLRKQIK